MKLMLDDHTLHTKTVDNTLAPTWEQSYKFPCDDACVALACVGFSRCDPTGVPPTQLNSSSACAVRTAAPRC